MPPAGDRRPDVQPTGLIPIQCNSGHFRDGCGFATQANYESRSLRRSPRASILTWFILAELAGEEEVMVRVVHWVCSVFWPVEKTIMEWKREAWKG